MLLILTLLLGADWTEPVVTERHDLGEGWYEQKLDGQWQVCGQLGGYLWCCPGRPSQCECRHSMYPETVREKACGDAGTPVS